MKKKILSVLIAFLLVFSILQVRTPIAKANNYIIYNFSISPNSGTKGDRVTISFSGTLFDTTVGGAVSGKTVTITAHCLSGSPSTTKRTNGSGYFSGSITGTISKTGSVTASYSGASASKTFTANNPSLSVTLSASPTSVVTKEPVNFTASASGGSGGYSYSWSGLGNGSGNGSSATGKWSSAGSKKVTVTVTDSSGSTISASKTISVHSLTASISGPTSGYTNTSYTFTCSASGSSGYSYSWSGGGSPSTGTGSSFTTKWSSAGSKTVRCTVSDSYGNSVQKSHSITISTQNNLSVSVSASPSTTVSTGTQVTLTATASGGTSPYSYSWSGGGVSGTSRSVSHTWNNAGSYTVTCTVKDSNNHTASKSITITVNNSASINSFTADPYSDSNNPLSPNTQVKLSWSTTGINYVYLYADSTYVGQYPGNSYTHVTPVSTTTYTIKDKDNTSISKSVTVYIASAADYTVTEVLNPTSGIAGQSISLEVSGSVLYKSEPNTSSVKVTIDASSLGLGKYTYSVTDSYNHTFTGTLPSDPGTYAITVSVAGVQGNSQDFTVNAEKKDTTLTLSKTNINITQGNNTTLTATLKDEDSNPVTGVTLNVGTNTNSSNIDADVQSQTNSNGQTTIYIRIDDSCPAGSYTLTVSFAGNDGYNSSSATATINVSQPTTLDHVTLSADNTTLEGGNSTNLHAYAYDTNGNDITNQVSFSWSKNSNKGTLNVAATGASTAIYTSDYNNYSVTITVQGALNGVTKTANVTITVETTTLTATIQNSISDIQSGDSHDFSVKVLYGTTDVTSSSTITWSATKGTLSSTSGSSVTWTAPTVSSDTDAQISVSVSYTNANNVTKTASDTCCVTVKAIQSCTLKVSNYPASTPAGNTTGTLYYYDISGTRQSVSVQGDGASHTFYPDNASLTLTVTNPFNFYTPNWDKNAPYEWNCDGLTGQTIRNNKDTYTYSSLTSDTYITANYFRKLHISASIKEENGNVVVTYSAFGGPYPSKVSSTVNISKIDLHIKQGDNPTATWNMNPDTVTLNGSSKSQSVSIDNLGLAPGTYTIYAKVTGNISNWAANGDTAYTDSIQVTVSGSLYVGNADPQSVHENDDSNNPHQHRTDILIETLDANGNPVSMPKPTVTVDGSGDVSIWSENADKIHWHATWYPGKGTGSDQGTVHYFTVNGKVQRPVTVYSGKVYPPYTITIQGFKINSASVDSTSDPNYVYIDVNATMSVVTWYTGSDDHETDPKLNPEDSITIKASLIDKEDGNITIGSDTFSGTADTKGLYSSGSDPGHPNTFTISGAIPMSKLTSNSGQKEEGTTQKNTVQLLSVKPVTGGVAVNLKVNGNTVQRTIILTGSATRADAGKIGTDYDGKVSATDQATDTTQVNIDVPSSTGTVIVHKTVTYGDGTTEPLPNVEFTLTDVNGKTYTDTTDSNGTITFNNIPVGSATVTETVPSGYTNNNPSQTVTVQKGQSAEADFTNQPVGATICIHKYNDDNGNGQEDSGEAASGITFTITSPNGGTYTVTTDSSGNVCQKVTVADTYTITEQVPSGYAAENNPQFVTITKDDLTTGATKKVTFVDVKNNGTIIVKKFEDLNGNGTWDSGEPAMSGVIFSISNNEHSYSGATDSTGTYTQSVVPGTYTVTESVPSGYAAEPSASQTVTVGSGESKTVTFGNKPADKKAEIKIFKFFDANGDGIYDTGAGDSPMGGVHFSLSGPETQSGSTDSSGYLTFTVTHTGTYTVTESVPSGYTAENNPQTVTIAQSDLDNNSTENLTFANKKKEYKIIVYKFEDDNGNGTWDSGEPAMSGVTFTCQNNSSTISGTTNSDGKVEFDLSESGIYTVTEQVPSGYKVTTDNPVVVNLSDSNSTAVINFGNQPTSAVLKVYVWNDINGNGQIDQGEAGVGGVTVSVSGANYATNSSGYIYVSVKEAGTLNLVETVPDGWTPTTPTTVQVTFTQNDINNGTTKEADFGIKTDQGTLEIHKFIDYNGNGTQDSGEPPQANIAFEIKGSNYDKTFVTDSNGDIVVSLPVGTYTVTESVPSGYTAENNPQTADITKDNTTTLTFANKPEGCTIHIHKFIDNNGNGSQDTGENDQSGVSFSIQLPDGSVANVTTDANGNATYIAKEPGTYTVTEQTPSGYTAENSPQSVTISDSDLTGGNKYLTFANKPQGKTIVIFKFNDKNNNGTQDSGEGPLSGISFTITGPNNFNKTVTTDSSGNASVAVQDMGTYTITEQVPSGYQCSTSNPVTVNISSSSPDTTKVTFGNYPTNAAAIHIHKFIDFNEDGSENGDDSGQPNVSFTITGPNNFNKTVTTDSSGNASVSVKDAGTYTVTEQVPDGYQAESGTQQITVTNNDIQNNNTLYLTFANKPPSAILEIRKYRDSNNNGKYDNTIDEPESGVSFTVKDLTTGATYHGVTDSDGRVRIPVVVPTEPGSIRQYSVIEIVPQGEECISSNPQTVTYYQSDGFDSAPIFLNKVNSAVIRIHKYNDDNGNGKEDSGEVASGISFTITGPNNFNKTVTTDSSGNASVSVKDAGTYTVTEQVPDGYKAETNPQSVTVTSSDINNHSTKSVTFVDIPNGEGTIVIYKFIDLNGNGKQDGKHDSGQSGVTFTVTGPNNFNETVTTNASGYAQVIVSTPGTYTVKETVPNNFTPTSNATQTVSFTKQEIINKTKKQLTFSNHPNTLCVTDGTTEPKYVITWKKADDQYNKITIIVYIGVADKPLFYPGATSATITIPKEEGMQSGLNNAPMIPQGLADQYGGFHTFTFTWYDVEDPNVVDDGTVRNVYVKFHNSIFGDSAVGCSPDISYVVKNPNHHVGGSAVDPIIQSLKHFFVSLRQTIEKGLSYVFNSPPFALLHKRVVDKYWLLSTIKIEKNALIAF